VTATEVDFQITRTGDVGPADPQEYLCQFMGADTVKKMLDIARNAIGCDLSSLLSIS